VIFGIGTDIVEYARMLAMWQRYGMRFGQKLLSVRELSELASHSDPARLLAKRFAAKEAFSKALGSGMRHPVSMPRIGITHDGLGKPVLEFDETLRAYLALLGVNGHHLSISDEKAMIVAFVVLESN
jgi:holo-[acyl-carrier protein] synthase